MNNIEQFRTLMLIVHNIFQKSGCIKQKCLENIKLHGPEYDITHIFLKDYYEELTDAEFKILCETKTKYTIMVVIDLLRIYGDIVG